MRTLAVCGAVLLSAACSKKSAPEYFALKADYEILVAREGDDAFEAPEMERILSGLRAISDKSREYTDAQALVTTIEGEQRRVKQARAALEALVARQAQPPTPPSVGSPRVAPAPEVEDTQPADAGQPLPTIGMSEQEFIELFGTCMEKAPPEPLPDGTLALAYRAKRACQARLGAPQGTLSFLFVNGKLQWTMVEMDAPRRDAGAPPRVEPEKPAPPAPPPAVDAGEPILTIPGAPLPPGFERRQYP
jgi:hypothetical protein